jgi:hypothetical protein
MIRAVKNYANENVQLSLASDKTVILEVKAVYTTIAVNGMEAMCHEPPYYRSETIITSHAVHT